jgi:hypothetical protein
VATMMQQTMRWFDTGLLPKSQPADPWPPKTIAVAYCTEALTNDPSKGRLESTFAGD